MKFVPPQEHSDCCFFRERQNNMKSYRMKTENRIIKMNKFARANTTINTCTSQTKISTIKRQLNVIQELERENEKNAAILIAYLIYKTYIIQLWSWPHGRGLVPGHGHTQYHEIPWTLTWTAFTWKKVIYIRICL